MQCREFEGRMNDLLDQRLVPERDGFLVRHAGECPACRRLLDGQVALFSGLELTRTPPLSSQFAAAVLVRSEVIPLATVTDTSPRRSGKWLGVIAGMASLAAIALVAVLIGWSWQQDAVRPVAKQSVQPVLPEAVDVAQGPSRKPVAPSQAIAKGMVTERPMPVSPGKEDYQEYREMFNSFGAQLPIAVEKIDEVQQATPAIRPLRASFSMALGTLQRTIPNRAKRGNRPLRNDSGFNFASLEIVA